MAEDLKGVQKAAILLIALGPEKSSMIFKHLKEEEIDKLPEKQFRMRIVKRIKRRKVLLINLF